MIRMNKKRFVSNMVAIRIPALFPAATIAGMEGRTAGEVVESKIFTASKHASKAKIVEAAQEEVRGVMMLFLILDRNVSQPAMQKRGDRSMVLDPKAAEGVKRELEAA